MTTVIRRYRLTLFVAALFAVLSASPAFAAKRASIADTLRDDGRFGTLLAALDAAGLTETFEGRGKFTLLAPTDAAFGKLPPDTVPALLADIPALTEVLTYHVLGRPVDSKKFLKRAFAPTLNGSSVLATAEGGDVFVNRALVVEADLRAKNGVIHVLDDVLLPPEEPVTGRTFLEALVLDGRFETLLAALEAADLADDLAGAKGFVLFAPTDEAFGNLTPGTVDALLADIPALTDILLFHVADERRGKAKQLARGPVTTLLGETVTVSLDPAPEVDGAGVLRADLRTANGYLHVLDAVLIPVP